MPQPPEPRARNPELGTQNPEPGTRNPEPGTRNPEPGTRNSEPGTRNPEPGTRNSEPGTRNPEPGTRDPGPSADEYCLTVESHFAARRGTPFIFSAKDWAVLQQWRDSGVPLPVVIEAIDQCFDKREKAGRQRVVSSLRYCRHAVNELWEERKEMLVGAGSGLPEMDPAVRLSELADEIERSGDAASDDSIRDELRRAAEGVRRIGDKKSVPLIEDELLEIEESLMDRLARALPAAERADLESLIASDLAGYSTDDPGVLDKTRKANLRRLIRLRLSLPRLSLFG